MFDSRDAFSCSTSNATGATPTNGITVITTAGNPPVAVAMLADGLHGDGIYGALGGAAKRFYRVMR